MKKLAILTSSVVLATAISAAAFAAPLQDYSAGRVALDVGVNMPSDTEYGGHECDDSNSIYAGATLGLGNNMAVNYKWNSYDANHFDTDTHQLNLMYKFAPGLSAYAGYLHSNTSGAFGDSQGSVQAGLAASYDVGFATVWGNVGFGTNNSGYEIGLSRAVASNVDLNISYYDQKVDDVLKDGDVDFKAKGVNAGVTFKF